MNAKRLGSTLESLIIKCQDEMGKQNQFLLTESEFLKGLEDNVQLLLTDSRLCWGIKKSCSVLLIDSGLLMLTDHTLLLLADGGLQQTCKHVKHLYRGRINPYTNVIIGDVIISKHFLSGDRLLVTSYLNALH